MALIFARLLQFLVLAISFKMMTHFLAPHELGRVSFILSIISLFLLVFINPVGMYQARNFLTWMRAGVVRPLFRGFVVYISLAWLLASLLFYFFSSSLFQSLQISFVHMVLILLGSIVFNTILLTLSTNLLLLERATAWSCFLIISSILALISMVCAATIFGGSAEVWLLGAAASYAFCALLITTFFFRNVTGASEDEEAVSAVFSWKGLRDFCLPLSGSVCAGWIIFQSYRVSLAGIVDLHTLGIFFAGYTLAAWIMNAVDLTATAYDGGQVYRDSASRVEEIRRNAWRGFIERLMPFYVVTAFSIAVISSELMTIFVAEKYQLAKEYLIAGAFVELVRVWLDKVSFLFQLEFNNSRLLPVSIFGAVGAVGATFGLVSHLGMYAPVYGALFAGLVITAVALRRVVFEHHDKRFSLYAPMIKSAICVISGALSFGIADMFFSSSSIWDCSVRVGFFSIASGFAFYNLVIKDRQTDSHDHYQSN